MTGTLATRQANIGDYILSVTTRDNNDDPALLEELTFRTIGAWMYIVGLIEQGKTEVGIEGSVESRLTTEKNVTLPEAFVDPRVTVWDTFRGNKVVNFHLNSDDNLQTALNTYYANQRGVERAAEKYGAKTAQNALPAHETSPAPGDVISATRAPTPNEINYVDGQLVSFTITKIVLGSRNSSVIYALWGTLGGGKYPLMTIYKCKPNSDENSPGYIAVKDTIVSLDLSFEKLEASGKWTLICKAAHAEKDGVKKEYLNPVSLESVA